MLDEFRSTYITWDKATSRIYSPVTANASDENGRKLVVQIVNSGQVEDLTGATLHLYWETRDKAHDGLDVFNAVDLEKGEFELSYTTGMLSNQGVLNANLVLIDTVGRVVSEQFKITVTKGIDNDAIQSENSFSSLTQALIEVGPRLNSLTAQLQQKIGSGKKAELEDLSPSVLSAIEGGEGTSFNLLSIPQDGSVDWKKTDFVKRGKNLFNKMKAIPGKRVSASNGNLFDASSFFVSEYIEVTPNQLYSRTNAQDSAGYDEDFNFVEGYSSSDTFTTGSNVVYVRLSVHINSLNEFQFESGERTPFKEFGYKLPLELPPMDEKNIEDESISFNKTSFIQRGKNLFNKNNVTQGYYPNNNTGALIANGSFSTSEYIPIKPNTSYKKRTETHYAIYDINKEFVKGGISSVIETEKDSRYVRIGVNNNNRETEQLEEGTVSTAYENYYLSIPDLKTEQTQALDNIVEVGVGKQYPNITSALNAITDASQTNRYTIKVHEGLYEETFYTKDYVDIIGENPNKCIVRYAADTVENWTNESTIFAESTSVLKNLTIKTLNSKYPVHSDAPTGPYTLKLINCILEHEGSTDPSRVAGTPIGIGAYPNQNFELIDCHLIGYNPNNSGASGINYHNLGNNSGLGYRYLKVKNTIIEQVRHGVLITTLDNSNGQENDVFLHNNVLNGESNAYLVSDAYSDYNSYRLHLVNNTRNGQYVE